MAGPDAISASIRYIRLAREDVAVLGLAPDAPFAWIAGQYLSLTLDGYPPRFYSIANACTDGMPEVHVRRSGVGGMTDHLVDRAAVGDRVAITGPFGEATLPVDNDRPVLLIAAGVGIAPLKAVMEHALAMKGAPQVTLVWGTNTASDQYLVPQFDALAATHDHLRFLPVTGVPVSEATAGFIRDYRTARVFVAGPPDMVRATRAQLERAGIKSDMIHHDPIPPAKAPA